MDDQLVNLGEGVSDIGAAILIAAIVLAVVWLHTARMRWRRPIQELKELEALKAENLISEKEYEKLRAKLIDRF